MLGAVGAGDGGLVGKECPRRARRQAGMLYLHRIYRHSVKLRWSGGEITGERRIKIWPRRGRPVELGAPESLLPPPSPRMTKLPVLLPVLAFLASALEIPAGILQLMGVIPIQQPTWYVLLRMATSVVEFALGLWMLRVWRACGVWAQGL